jgi:DNA-nicking Smr family endonuclease
MSARRLSDDERVLWQGVARSVAPLRKPARTRAEPAAQPPAAGPAKPQLQHKPPPGPAAAVPARPALQPALAPLGRRLKQRLARGTHAIEGRLDLHGLTQAQAHDALHGFLRSAQVRGSRIVLVITGKGDAHGERGVLRRQVPHWLRLPELRGTVVGFEPAGAGHGGEGALYVRLRRGQRGGNP